MRLSSINIAVVRTDEWTGRMGRTGIDKRPISGLVKAHKLGIAGDTVCDTKEHGGLDRAAYAYAREDAKWWEEVLNRRIPPGGVGENLTTMGVDLNHSLIGERWAIGTAVFEVSSPRMPCRVFERFWNVSDLVQRFIDHGRPGAYLRIIAEGYVSQNDPITIVYRPGHDVTIGEAFRALTSEPCLLPRLLDAEALPHEVMAKVRRRVGRHFVHI